MCSLFDLPFDIQGYIFTHFLEQNERPSLRFVCKRLRRLDHLKLDKGLDFLKSSAFKAVQKGHLKLLKWLWEICKRRTRGSHILREHAYSLAEYAVQSKSVEMVKWLTEALDREPSWKSIIFFTARAGNSEIFNLLCNQWEFKITSRLWECAAEGGCVEILKKLCKKENDPVVKKGFIEALCKSESIPAIEWFFSRRSKTDIVVTRLDHNLGNKAAQAGKLSIVKWLYESGYKGMHRNGMFKGFAESGCIEGLIYIQQSYLQKHNKELPNNWYQLAAGRAVVNGHLDVLKWTSPYRINNIHEDISTLFEIATSQGYIEILRYLKITFEYMPTASNLLRSAINGHEDAVKWMIEELHMKWNEKWNSKLKEKRCYQCGNNLIDDEDLMCVRLRKRRKVIEYLSTVVCTSPSISKESLDQDSSEE